jgi:hypothetical protein
MFLRNSGNQIQHNLQLRRTRYKHKSSWKPQKKNGYKWHKICKSCEDTLYSYVIHMTGEGVKFSFKGSKISTRRKSPLTTEATCLTVTSEPSCSVIKLKWKFEVLAVITVNIPASWNVKSCSLWTHTSEKSLQCICQNKRDHIKRREQSSRLKLSGEHN